MRIPQRAACEALCAEYDALLYQLHWRGDGSGRLREGNGWTAHIYWPFDPADPGFRAIDPIVSSYTHGDTPIEATQNALNAIARCKRDAPFPRRKGLIDNMAALEAAIDHLTVAIRG